MFFQNDVPQVMPCLSSCKGLKQPDQGKTPATSCKSCHGLKKKCGQKQQQMRGQSSLMNDTNPPQRMHKYQGKVYQFTFLKHLLCFCKTDLYRGMFFLGGGSHSVSDRTLNGSPDKINPGGDETIATWGNKGVRSNL